MTTRSKVGAWTFWLVGVLLVLSAAPAAVRGQCEPSWSGLGAGVEAGGQVRALAVFDDGSGPALYAGGVFETMDGVVVNHIARWDGQSWSGVGGGVSAGSWVVARIDGLRVIDMADGNGPALYVGGSFQYAGGVLVNGIARWDGSQWNPLGSGLTPLPEYEARVFDMSLYDPGTGAELYVGGLFQNAGGVVAGGLAKWNGTVWSSVAGWQSAWYPIVGPLYVYDDGTGPALHVGGTFYYVGGFYTNNIAKWNGYGWSPLSLGLARST